MRHVRFAVHTNEEVGYVGIIPLIFRNWSNYTPTTFAGHDLIDHTTDEKGEVFQELRALGANFFVHGFGRNSPARGKEVHPAKFEAKRNSGENLQNILEDQDGFWEGEVSDLPETPKYKLTRKEKTLFKYFWHTFCLEMDRTLEDEYIEETTHNWFKKNEGGILAWFEYGYANAKRRYKGEAAQVEYTKKKIDDLLKKAMKSLEMYADSGEEFTLSFDVENSYVEIRGHGWNDLYFSA